MQRLRGKAFFGVYNVGVDVVGMVYYTYGVLGLRTGASSSCGSRYERVRWVALDDTLLDQVSAVALRQQLTRRRTRTRHLRHY